jgi:hypothetical protein
VAEVKGACGRTFVSAAAHETHAGHCPECKAANAQRRQNEGRSYFQMAINVRGVKAIEAGGFTPPATAAEAVVDAFDLACQEMRGQLVVALKTVPLPQDWMR